jgi:hypothetical protein
MATVTTLPGIAQAGDDIAQTETADTEAVTQENQVSVVLTTLPVLGTGLSVTINRDDSGAITSVGLDPADAATVIKEKDHKVAFLLNDGNTEVVVKARGQSVQTKVKADATADVTGPGSWSADVFGTGAVTIPYTVSFDGINPTVTLGEIVAPEGVTAEVGEPKVRTSDDGDKSSYHVKVKLTSGDDRAKVSFAAKTHVNDEGQVEVRLAVTLSSRDWDKDRDDRERRDRSDRDDDERRRDKDDRDQGDRDRDDDERGERSDRDDDGDDRGNDDD